MARLQDKVAVLTGAGGAIGAAAARLFVDEGASVLLVDVDPDAVSVLARSLGTRAAACKADVTRPEDAEAYARAAAERFGGIDILLANAGIEGAVGARIDASDIGAFDRVLAVNVRGVYLALRAVLPYMIRRGGGSVVISSSVAGVVAVPGASAYVTSKHALTGLARVAAVEYARDGIRVNTINPAPVRSRMMDAIEHGLAPGAEAVARRQITATIPAGRYAEPEEVARLMLFLASGEASMCTGATYLADGGIAAA